MYRRIFIAALWAILLAPADGADVWAKTPPRPKAPLDMTISTIHKDPWRYHGTLVRVRGTFDQCFWLICNFCESATPPTRDEEWTGTCMGVSFAASEKLEPGGSKALQSLMEARARDLTERNVRFATVTLEARYDAGCSGVQNPKSDIIIVCTDRAPELVAARVVRVHIRRPATAGYLDGYRGEDKDLMAAGKDDAKALEAAFLAALAAPGPDGRAAGPDYLFLEKPPLPKWRKTPGIEARGGACICLLDDCTGIQWPRRLPDVLFDIPANPYKCWMAEKSGGVWKFPLQ